MTHQESVGTASLLQLVELFQGEEQRKAYESAYLGTGIRYGDLKKDLAEAIFEELKPIQEKRQELEANPEYVDKMIQRGAEQSREIASKTVQEVKSKLGLA